MFLQSLTEKLDIYSMAMIFYSVLAGKPPLDSRPHAGVPAVDPSWHPGLAEVSVCCEGDVFRFRIEPAPAGKFVAVWLPLHYRRDVRVVQDGRVAPTLLVVVSKLHYYCQALFLSCSHW